MQVSMLYFTPSNKIENEFKMLQGLTYLPTRQNF